MAVEHFEVRKQFERGVVILSLDTEQIWGYLDLLSERSSIAGIPARLRPIRSFSRASRAPA